MDHDKDNAKVTIGSFNLSFDSSLEEGSVGRKSIDGIGLCTIHIYSGERTIPHFHIESNDGKFICCVCILKPNYFIHPGKEGTLNSKQCKELDEFLRSEYKGAPFIKGKITIWQMICIEWNNNNPKYAFEITKNTTQPDYHKISKELKDDKNKGLKEDSTWLIDSYKE